MKIRRSIRDLLKRGDRAQGSELRPSDVGRRLDWSGFGRTQAGDVGKRVWLRSWGLVMENNEQRDARKVEP